MATYRRFYFENINIDNIKINKKLEHRLFKVLRLKEQDIIELCDGNGNVFTVSLNKDSFTLINKEHILKPLYNITVAASLINIDRFKIIVEKLTELGVNKLIPIISEHTKVFLNTKNLKEKLKTVSEEALSQCKTAYTLNIEDTKNIKELNLLNYDKVLVFHPDPCGKNISSIDIKQYKNILLVFGPEGGFSNSDLKILNYPTYNLTNNLLRAETAVIYAASIIDHYFNS